MTVEELKEKVDRLKQLNKELMEAVGVYMCTDSRGFIQADAVTIAKYAKENGLKVEIKTRKCDRYPGEVTVPGIKMYGVADAMEIQKIRALLDKEVPECTAQATEISS